MSWDPWHFCTGKWADENRTVEHKSSESQLKVAMIWGPGDLDQGGTLSMERKDILKEEFTSLRS